MTCESTKDWRMSCDVGEAMEGGWIIRRMNCGVSVETKGL